MGVVLILDCNDLDREADVDLSVATTSYQRVLLQPVIERWS